MPKPTTPGVYVQEIPSGARAVTPVETGTAAILGPVPGNPAPALVSSAGELAAMVGQPQPDGPFLPWAAEGFFANGGRRLLVVPTDFAPDSFGTALAHLAARSDIALLLAPDLLNPSVVPGISARKPIEARLVAHATEQRDKLLLLALPQSVSSATDPAVTDGPQSAFAACWHPWITARPGRMSRSIPPTGHIAGLIARTDQELGVHKAPANQIVRGLGEPPLAIAVSTARQEPFTTAGINLIRDLRAQNRGVRAWGARTLSADPDWRYINVRRLAILVERSLARGLAWAVFEPDDEPLWARLRASAEDFLFGLWRQGALAGDKPERAFFVRCDRTTMTEADIGAGRIVLLVGLAPLRPAEFLIIRLALTAGAPDA
jgi:uncharacterized protein